MFVVRITMLEGRSDEQKEMLHSRLAGAVAHHFEWDSSDVRTVIQELPARHWGIAGVSVASRNNGA